MSLPLLLRTISSGLPFSAFLDLKSTLGSNIKRSQRFLMLSSYKPFENSRNKEIGQSYPDLEDSFLKINDMTYDLYDPFSEYKYFDRRFQGSASIKKVLPVLVPGLSYEHLNIGKGDKAMNKLAELIRGDISDSEAIIQTAKDLLVYCRQDSWAMVEIYKKLLS